MADIQDKPDKQDIEKIEIQNRPDKPLDNRINVTKLKALAYTNELLTNGYNQTRAYKAINPNIVDDNTAHYLGYNLTKSNTVQSLLGQIANNYRAGVEFQVAQLSNIMRGEYVKSTIYKTYDADGELIRTQEVVSKPSARDITSAINLISKLTGQQDAMRLNANAMSGELKRLYKAHTAEKPRHAKGNVQGPEPVVGGEGACVDLVSPLSSSDTNIFTRGIKGAEGAEDETQSEECVISETQKNIKKVNATQVNEQGEELCKDGSRKGKRGGARVKRPLVERIKNNGLSPRGRTKDGEITVKVDSVDCRPDLGAFSEDLEGFGVE